MGLSITNLDLCADGYVIENLDAEYFKKSTQGEVDRFIEYVKKIEKVDYDNPKVEYDNQLNLNLVLIENHLSLKSKREGSLIKLEKNYN